MSRVFVAEEVALGRRVVVKVLAPELAEGLSAERFAREARLAARLHGDFSFFDDLLSRARARAATETDRNFLSQMQFNLAMEAGQAGRAARIAADLPNRLAERMFAATFWDGDSTAGAAQYAEARALVSARPPAEPNARHAWITTIFDVAQYELARGDTTNASRAIAQLHALPAVPHDAVESVRPGRLALILDAQLAGRADAGQRLNSLDSLMRLGADR